MATKGDKNYGCLGCILVLAGALALYYFSSQVFVVAVIVLVFVALATKLLR